MNTKLIAGAVGVASMLGLTSVASAAEFDWYGSIRAGAIYNNPDTAADPVWDLGATGSDGESGAVQGIWSRIGVRGSTDLGGDSSAGFQVEQGIANGGLNVRHHNVWLGGSWGKLTLGQQGNPYRSARNWDQTYFLGGQFGWADGGSRAEGIRFDSNLGGALNFTVMATGSDTEITETGDPYVELDELNAVIPSVPWQACPNNQCPVTVVNDVVTAITVGNIVVDSDTTITLENHTVTDGTMFEAELTFAGVSTQTDAVNEMIYTIGEVMEDANGDPYVTIAHPDSAPTTILVQGPTTLPVQTDSTTSASGENGIDRWIMTASYDAGSVAVNFGHNSRTSDNGYDNTAIAVNGVLGGLDWYTAYQKSNDNTSAGNDVNSFGGFASYGIDETNKVYLYYVNHDQDSGADPTETVFGYSRKLGDGVSFNTEYLSVDEDTDVTPKTLVMAVKVDF